MITMNIMLFLKELLKIIEKNINFFFVESEDHRF